MIKNTWEGTSLLVRWLKLGAPNAEGTGSIPGQGTKISHAKTIKITKIKKKIWEDVHRLYADISYAILYKGLEHRQILVSAGGPGTNPLWIPKDNSTINPTDLFIVYALVSPCGYRGTIL